MNLPKMVDSDKSDNGESQTTAKRLREDNSGDEKIELPSKRPRSKSPEPTENADNKKDTPVVQVTNGSTLPSEEQTDIKVIDEMKNGEADATDNDVKTPAVEKDVTVKVDMEVEEPLEKPKEDTKKEEEEKVEVKTEKDIKKGDTKPEEEDKLLKQKKSKDSEVVDGLELSVECASDKEASSSESEKEEKDSQPRPKTIIVKAKPNDSELEVGSSEAEKSDDEEQDVENDTANKKRSGKRKAASKASSEPSEESLESNSDDEDYSPRTKKKLQKPAAAKKATPPKSKTKKSRESKKKPETESEDDKSESEDEEMNLADRAKKKAVLNETKSKGQKDDSESESLDEDESESDDKTKKNGRRKNVKRDPMANRTIKNLRKYITTAGIRVKYEVLWSGCKSNKQRADRIKKLLAENGIDGRPTLEKCRKLKEKNNRKKEVAELDTSNIISEGRVTRARRSEANKATKDRETRNLFKRIQPVCDSDTE